MKLLIQFPTRERPKKFLDYLFEYLYLLEDKKNFAVHVSCDKNDLTMNNKRMKKILSLLPNTEVSYNNNRNKIEACNAGVSERDWDIVIDAADDMLPLVKGWDNIIREGFKEHFPDLDGVLHFNDGYQKDKLNTLCILGRKYYDRFSYIYHPDYISLYADNEFDDVSRKLNKRVYIDEVIIKHEHPVTNKKIKADMLHKKNVKFDDKDRETYQRRKTNGI